MPSVGTKKGETEYLVWTPYLVGGVQAYRYELANGTTLEVIPGFDREVEGYHWGVLWPEKKHRQSGSLVVSRSAKRVGGRARVEDEDGSLHVTKTIARAKELAEAALASGRPPDGADAIRSRMGSSV